MRTLQVLYAYNAWANARAFAVCRALDRGQPDERAPGTVGTLEETLKHMVSVEDAYAHMLQDGPPTVGEEREAYFAHDILWFAKRAEDLGHTYQEILARADASFFDAPLAVPWFDFALTKHDGLLQVLSHSAQHRAQVFSVLGERGLEVPDLDYVLYVEGQQGQAR